MTEKISERAMKAANDLFDKGIPYWTSLDCYAKGWEAGHRAAMREANKNMEPKPWYVLDKM